MGYLSALLASGSFNIGWKAILAIVGFFAFIAILITLGVASATESLSIVIGMFIIAVALGGVVTQRIPYNSPVFIMLFIVGLFFLVINPGEKFTVMDFLRSLGIEGLASEVIAWI